MNQKDKIIQSGEFIRHHPLLLEALRKGTATKKANEGHPCPLCSNHLGMNCDDKKFLRSVKKENREDLCKIICPSDVPNSYSCDWMESYYSEVLSYIERQREGGYWRG